MDYLYKSTLFGSVKYGYHVITINYKLTLSWICLIYSKALFCCTCSYLDAHVLGWIQM